MKKCVCIWLTVYLWQWGIWLSTVADRICDTVGTLRVTHWPNETSTVSFLSVIIFKKMVDGGLQFLNECNKHIFHLFAPGLNSFVRVEREWSQTSCLVSFCARSGRMCLILPQSGTLFWLEVCLKQKQEGSGADSPPLMMFYWGWSSNQSSAAWDFPSPSANRQRL